MRSILATLPIALACVTGPGTARASAILSIQDLSASLGDTVTVEVDISDVSDLYAFQFDLIFDPTIMSDSSSTEGPFLPGGGATFFIPGTIDNVNGAVSQTADTLLSAVAGVNGSGALAFFQFSAIGAGYSALAIPIDSVILLDSNLNEIPFDVTNGSLTVQDRAEAPEPAPEFLLGMGLLGCGMALQKRRTRPPTRDY
jgi:Cohesin domain